METQDVKIVDSEKPIEVVNISSPQDVKIVDSEKPIEVVNVASENDTPIPVKVMEVEKNKPKVIQKPDGTHTLEPDTTEQQDITTAGQRKINLIWENTQSWIAITVTVATMAVGLIALIGHMFFGKPDVQIPTIFAVAFGTVIGFYFARTNHQAIGGTGPKADTTQSYKGR